MTVVFVDRLHYYYEATIATLRSSFLSLCGKAAHPDLPGGKATYTQPTLVNVSLFYSISLLSEDPSHCFETLSTLPTGKGFSTISPLSEMIERDGPLRSDKNVHECDATTAQ